MIPDTIKQAKQTPNKQSKRSQARNVLEKVSITLVVISEEKQKRNSAVFQRKILVNDLQKGVIFAQHNA